jgi:hypothetical protein
MFEQILGQDSIGRSRRCLGQCLRGVEPPDPGRQALRLRDAFFGDTPTFQVPVGECGEARSVSPVPNPSSSSRRRGRGQEGQGVGAELDLVQRVFGASRHMVTVGADMRGVGGLMAERRLGADGRRTATGSGRFNHCDRLAAR